MRYFLTLVLLGIACCAFGLITIDSSTTWSGTQTFSESVLVTGTGTTLTIQAGSQVKFDDHYSISVTTGAKIWVLGTENNWVTFDVDESGQSPSWDKILLSGSVGSRFSYCHFRNSDGGVVNIESSQNVGFNDIDFYNCPHMISANATNDISLSKCQFNSNGLPEGIFATGMNITNNSPNSFNSSNIRFSMCNFSHLQDGAIDVSQCNSLYFLGCTFTNNTRDEIEYFPRNDGYGDLHHSAAALGISLTDSIQIEDCTFRVNEQSPFPIPSGQPYNYFFSSGGSPIELIHCINVSVTNNEFSNNIACGNGTLAINWLSNSSEEFGNINITGCNFYTNMVFANSHGSPVSTGYKTGCGAGIAITEQYDGLESNRITNLIPAGRITVENNTFSFNYTDSSSQIVPYVSYFCRTVGCGYGGALYTCYSSGVPTDILSNYFEFNGAETDGGAVCALSPDQLILDDNHFFYCGADRGGAIAIFSPTDCSIENNKVEYCDATLLIDDLTTSTSGKLHYYCSGGGVYISGDCTFTGNKLLNNSARLGGGVFWKKTDITSENTVSSSMFTGNTAYSGGGLYFEVSDLLVSETGSQAYYWINSHVENCTFYGNQSYKEEPISSNLTTLPDYCQGSAVYLNSYSRMDWTNLPVSDITNSVFWDNFYTDYPKDKGGQICLSDYRYPNKVNLTGNIVNQVKYGSVEGWGIIRGIDYYDDYHYTPVTTTLSTSNADPVLDVTSDDPAEWTLCSNSPCVSNDTVNIGADFGISAASSFATALPHTTISGKISKPRSISWISLPVIPRTANDSIDVFGVFSTIAGNLNKVQGLNVSHYRTSFGYVDPALNWSYPDSIFAACSNSGLKVKLTNNNSANNFTSYGPKLRNDISNTLLPNGDYINGTFAYTSNNKRNWVGYWGPVCKDADAVVAALGTLLDNTNVGIVKHESWSINRIGGNLSMTNIPYLNPGDMLDIGLAGSSNVTFNWTIAAATREEPVVPVSSSHFTYDEDFDYIPINIQLPSDDTPQEIGAFVNGVCVGATVVTDSLAQILAYVNELPEGEDIQLQFYYGRNMPDEGRSGYWQLNPATGYMEKAGMKVDNSRSSYYISYRKDGGGNAPTAPLYSTNYPNPFNPSTTIKFNMPQSGKAELAVYNVRGQKVRTLVNDTRPQGVQTVVFNGRDDAGNTLASGVYLYRVTAGGKSVTQKMLLVK